MSSVDRDFKIMMERKKNVLLEAHNLINQFNDLTTMRNNAYSSLRHDYKDCCADINNKIDNLTTVHNKLVIEYNKTRQPGMIVQTHIHTMNNMKKNIKHNLDEGFELHQLIINRHGELNKVHPSNISDTIRNINSSSTYRTAFSLPPAPTNIPRKKGGKRKTRKTRKTRRTIKSRRTRKSKTKKSKKSKRRNRKY